MMHFLRLVHILAGVFWVGTAVFTAFFLAPSLRAVGPAGGQVMQQLAQVRKLPRYLMTAMALTILSGFAMYWRASGGFTNGWVSSGPGMTFGIGGVLAILAASIGFSIGMPAAKQLGAIAGAVAKSGGPPSPDQAAEMQRLQGRMAKATALGSILLVFATAAMAVARYVA